MTAPSEQREQKPLLALGTIGALAAFCAVLDKLVGVVNRTLPLATLSYTCLCLVVAWCCVWGIRIRHPKPLRISPFAALVSLIFLTAGYIVAWRASADPTPILYQGAIRAILKQGDDLLDAGQKTDAYIQYKDAFRRFPNSYSVLRRLGVAEYQLGDFEHARKHFQQALTVAAPDKQWRILNFLGQTEWKLGNQDAAIGYYDRAEREGMPASERVEWHYRLGWAYFDRGDYQSAIREYESVVHGGDRYVAASYYNIGCAQAQELKQTKDATARSLLIKEAIANLGAALKAIRTPDERKSLRDGLMGGPRQRDPELAPLRNTEAFHRFLQSVDY